MNSDKKVVVLTPVKNEAWILEIFLKVTSTFADHILIADQNSDDKSVEIARQFPKVDVIKNNSGNFNEAGRQELLINTARENYGKGNILLALDADEIIAHNSLKSDEWKEIHSAAPGTVLFFEKPTFYQNTSTAIRYEEQGGWPLGFVDDGTKHKPGYIHSTRIPFHENSKKLYLKEIKFLHCNLLSLKRQRSKVRYYCLLESVAKSKKWYHRILYYNKNYDYARQEGDGLTQAQPEWTRGWEEKGIDLNTLDYKDYYWYDVEALKILSKYSSHKFWLDDVWDINWEKVIKHYNCGNLEVKQAPVLVSAYRGMLYYFIKSASHLKNLKRG